MDRFEAKIFNIKQDVQYYKQMLHLKCLECYQSKRYGKISLSLMMKIAELKHDHQEIRRIRDFNFLRNDFNADGSFKKKTFSELRGVIWDRDIQDPDLEKTFDYNVVHVKSPLDSTHVNDHFDRRRNSDPRLVSFLREKYGNKR